MSADAKRRGINVARLCKTITLLRKKKTFKIMITTSLNICENSGEKRREYVGAEEIIVDVNCIQ